MKNILITGGAGLIGAFLCRKLISQNNIYCIDNFITSSEENISDLFKFNNFYFFEHDICKDFPKKINNIKFDYIYHLACPTGVPNLTKLSLEMLRTCSIGTENILNISLKHKSKFLFTSSSEIYGDPLLFPQSETYTGNVDPVGIRSPYEEGKRFSESLIFSYFRKYNLDIKIVRLFNVFGPKSSEDKRVVTTFINAAVKNKPIKIEGDGSQTRTFLHVEDLVDALILIMNKGKKGEIYNIGSIKEISILELANLIINITKSKSKIEFIKRPNHDHHRRLPDVSKLISLGWNQNLNIHEGLKKL